MEIPGCGPNRNKSDQILGKGFTTKPRAKKTLQSQTCTRSTLRTSGTPPVENHRVSTKSPAPARPVSLTGQTGPAQKTQSGENSIFRNPNCTKLEQQLSLDNPSTSVSFPRENPKLTCTGQTCVGHRSDRCGSGTSGKIEPRAKLNLLLSRSHDLLNGFK